jgi:hypothetical protein
MEEQDGDMAIDVIELLNPEDLERTVVSEEKSLFDEIVLDGMMPDETVLEIWGDVKLLETMPDIGMTELENERPDNTGFELDRDVDEVPDRKSSEIDDGRLAVLASTLDACLDEDGIAPEEPLKAKSTPGAF